jgi:hypothetical protein
MVSKLLNIQNIAKAVPTKDKVVGILMPGENNFF